MATAAAARDNGPAIGADSYTGERTVRRGLYAKVGTTAARDFAARHGANVEFVVWEFSHMIDGERLFVRTRLMADESGALHSYDAAGNHIGIHPAGRPLTVLMSVRGTGQ